jgi:hypothetical protein
VSHVAQNQPTKPGSTARRKQVASAIDRDKLRTALRRLGDEYVFYMLDDAIELLPPAKLVNLVSRYLDVKQLRPDGPSKKNLLAEVRTFATASRAGKYYESFNVNSKNFMDKSMGTRAFIADCNRLLDRCVTQASKGEAAEIREAIEIILDVLRYIDECHDDVIFFADEAGSWQVGVDWAKVLPAWFSCLSRTTQPEEYARRVVEFVVEFDEHHLAKHLAAARRIGTPPQREALRNAVSPGRAARARSRVRDGHRR